MIDGYQELWQAVLLQIVTDALMPDHRATGPEALERRRSRDILTRGGAHFNRICAFAGVDPTAVKDAFRLGKCRVTPGHTCAAKRVYQRDSQAKAKAWRSEGRTTREIAALLDLSPETVRKYVRT